MKDDQSIQEIRRIRHEISASCGHDLDKFFAFMKKEEKRFQPQINRFHELNKHYVMGSQPVSLKLKGRKNRRQRASRTSLDLKAA